MLSLKTVPLLKLPPLYVTPYNVSPERTNSPCGLTPSTKLVNHFSTVNPVPSLLTLNTVPRTEPSPSEVVPYKVPSGPTVTGASGCHPVTLVSAPKLCTTEYVWAVTRCARIKPRPTISVCKWDRFVVPVFTESVLLNVIFLQQALHSGSLGKALLA